jgi:hypothetical protein
VISPLVVTLMITVKLAAALAVVSYWAAKSQWLGKSHGRKVTLAVGKKVTLASG